MKRDLLVGVAQWLAAPGEPRQNMNVALSMMDDAASRGVELLVLPELWSCGYDPETLAQDARADAEPLQGPRTARLGAAELTTKCGIKCSLCARPVRAKAARLSKVAWVGSGGNAEAEGNNGAAYRNRTDT